MTNKRVKFDFDLAFTNGGGLQGQDFRLDIAGDDISDDELASYIIRDLRLLMVGAVRILNKEILVEPHKRPAPAPGELATLTIDLRRTPLALEEVLRAAQTATVRVIAADGESFLVRRAAG
jgi:arylformamidase